MKITPRMEDFQGKHLGLERLFVVHSGEDRYLLHGSIEALPVRCIPALSRRPEFTAG